jgi:5-methylcytosine-specific restriction enzyme subunit McrC
MSADQPNYIGRIPVQNIWLLMAYAAEFSHLNTRTKSLFIDNSDNLPDLVIDLLCKSVESRLKLGLTRGFISCQGNLRRVRGRINHLKTERRLLLHRGQVACEFTELSNDTPRNRYVSHVLSTMASRVTDNRLALRSKKIVRVLRELGVSDTLPTPSELSKDRLGRHDVADKEMIELAKIAHTLAVPTEHDGVVQHFKPDKNERWVRKLFEKAIAGFYRKALSDDNITVRTGTPLNWQYTEATRGLPKILPSMKADIIIDDLKNLRRIIIDTKFNSVIVPGYKREETLRSGYLYQIYAYLRTQESHLDAASLSASGVLLHPAVGESVYEAFTVQNHRILFATVDLGENNERIKSQLADILSIAA